MFENLEYTRPIDPTSAEHDLMAVEDFRGTVQCGGFNDYDGVGDLVQCRDGAYFRCQSRAGQVSPSQWRAIPATATHVAWYNR